MKSNQIRNILALILIIDGIFVVFDVYKGMDKIIAGNRVIMLLSIFYIGYKIDENKKSNE